MISVIIPVYNEGKSVISTYEEIVKVFEESSIDQYEIIAVNDGSSDDTADHLGSIPIKVINHPHNLGYGRSLKDGIKAAQYDLIIITDADQTYPFHFFQDLYDEYKKGFDMVVGKRTGDHYTESCIKSPLRRILRILVEFAAERKIPDINSGFRLFRKSQTIPFFNKLCETFSFTTSLTLAYMMTGKTVSYVDIPYYKRAGKTKVKLIKDSLRTLRYILQAINYYNPLKTFFLLTILCFMGAICGFMGSMFLGLNSAFFIGVGGILMCPVIISIGLVADLLKQIMDESKKTH